MRVIDPKRIKKLMAIQDVSTRQLAEVCGYQSHAYIGRILRGEITTITPERAARIARHLQVGIDDLFMPRLSSDPSHSAKGGKAA
jgi:transcriptional regulator with XRE-family HTH domain